MAGPIPKDVLASAMTTASDFQRQKLQDGHLSISEYESAKLAFVSCLSDHGLSIQGDTRLNGLYRYDFMIIRPANDPAAAQNMDACYTEYSSTLDDVWGRMTTTLVARVVGEAEQWAADCLRQHGLEPEKFMGDRATTPEEESVYQSCVAAASRQFDLGNTTLGARDR